jgi:hypothetical protein
MPGRLRTYHGSPPSLSSGGRNGSRSSELGHNPVGQYTVYARRLGLQAQKLIYMLLVMRLDAYAPYYATIILPAGDRGVQAQPPAELVASAVSDAQPHQQCSRLGVDSGRYRPRGRWPVLHWRCWRFRARAAALCRRQYSADASRGRDHQLRVRHGHDCECLLHLPVNPARPGAGRGRLEPAGQSSVYSLLGA